MRAAWRAWRRSDQMVRSAIGATLEFTEVLPPVPARLAFSVTSNVPPVDDATMSAVTKMLLDAFSVSRVLVLPTGVMAEIPPVTEMSPARLPAETVVTVTLVPAFNVALMLDALMTALLPVLV